MKIREVFAANKMRQVQARGLNMRAGRGVFKVYRPEEISAFVVERLNGAKRQAEIANLEVLLLPALDQAEIARIERENPLEIELVGKKFPVDYRTMDPIVSIGEDVREPDSIWQKIPDGGVFLPGGRSVFLTLGWVCEEVGDTDIPKLKEGIRNYLNQKQWDSWKDQPEIILPDLSKLDSEDSMVAPICEIEYGTCQVTGAPLVAFGVAVVNCCRYYSDQPHFVGRWFQKQSEAEVAREKAVEKLAALRKEVADKKLLADLTIEAKIVKKTASDVYGVYCAHGGDMSLKGQLYERAYAYLPEDLERLQQWITETAELTRKALAEVGEFKKAKEKREREIVPLVARVGTEQAEFVYSFVEELVEKVGAFNAHRRLSAEYTADYGRARRQSALADICAGEKGRQFLAFSQAQNVDRALEGAIFWLEQKYRLQPIPLAVKSPVVPSSVKSTSIQSSVKPTSSPSGQNSFGTSLEGLFDGLKL